MYVVVVVVMLLVCGTYPVGAVGAVGVVLALRVGLILFLSGLSFWLVLPSPTLTDWTESVRRTEHGGYLLAHIIGLP